MQLKDVLDAIRPRAIRGAVSDTRNIEYLLTDSRQLWDKEPEKTLFFAIKTAKDNGANYVPALIEKGVKTFVLDYEMAAAPFADTAEGVLFLYVTDVVAVK